jgi:hypothetical protein
MFDSTFFKFFIVFILIVGISSVIISYVGGLNVNPSIDVKTAQPAQ